MSQGRNIAQLFATLSLDTRNFVNGITQATRSVTSASSGMQRSVGSDLRNSLNETRRVFDRFSRESSGHIKSVSRIITGILISQAFYSLIRTIKDATKAVWEFAMEAEKAAVAFTLLLRDSDKAFAFGRELERFAAATPLSIKQSRKMGETLLSMGYQASSVLNVMRSIMDASVVGGGTSEVLESITMALGKIKALGRLTAREVNSLARARVPIYDILREELKLTEKQMRNIGKLDINADVAISAILRGINKKFSGASEALAKTMSGMIEQIFDNLLFMGGYAIEDMYEGVKSKMEGVLKTLIAMKDVTEGGGLGGLADTLLPKGAAGNLRAMLASFKQFNKAVATMWQTLKPLLGGILQLFGMVGATILPVLNGILLKLAELFQKAVQTVPAIRYLVTAIVALAVGQVVGVVLFGLAKAIVSLKIARVVAQSIMLLYSAIKTLLVLFLAHPLVGAITLTALALGAFALGSDRVQASIKGASARLKEFLGLNKNALLPSTKKQTEQTDEWGDSFEDTAKATAGVGDAAKEAAKKVKNFLTGFDEVTTIPEAMDKASDSFDFGDLEDMENIPSMGIEGLDIEPFKIPELGSLFTDLNLKVGEFFRGFNTKLQGLSDGFAKVFQGWDRDTTKTIIDMTVGVLQFLTPWVGAVIKLFTDLTVEVLGRLLGFDRDTIDLTKELVRKFIELMVKWVQGALGHLGEGLKALVDLFIDWDGESFDAFTKWAGDTLQIFVDWAADCLIEISNFVMLFIGKLLGMDDESIKIMQGTMAKFINMLRNMVKDFIAGVTGLVRDTIKLFTDWEDNTLRDFAQWALDMILGIAGWAGNFLGELFGWDQSTREAFNAWITDTKENFVQWVIDFIANIGTWSTDTIKAIGEWIINTSIAILGWSTDTGAAIQTWVTDRVLDFINWGVEVGGAIQTWAAETGQAFIDWATSTGGSIQTWVTDVCKALTDWSADTIKAVADWVKDTKGKIASWATDTLKGFNTWTTNAKADLLNGWDKIAGGLQGKFDGIAGAAKRAFDGMKDNIKGTINSIIGMINKFIEKFNSIKIEVPAVDIPLVGKVGGFSIGMPAIPNIPMLAKGGIVSKATMAVIGEGSAPKEAAIPLSRQGLQPFAEAMMAIMSESSPKQLNNSTSNSDGLRPVYVGTLIADERSLKQLERKLNIIRLQESDRRG